MQYSDTNPIGPVSPVLIYIKHFYAMQGLFGVIEKKLFAVETDRRAHRTVIRQQR